MDHFHSSSRSKLNPNQVTEVLENLSLSYPDWTGKSGILHSCLAQGDVDTVVVHSYETSNDRKALKELHQNAAAWGFLPLEWFLRRHLSYWTRMICAKCNMTRVRCIVVFVGASTHV